MHITVICGELLRAGIKTVEDRNKNTVAIWEGTIRTEGQYFDFSLWGAKDTDPRTKFEAGQRVTVRGKVFARAWMPKEGGPPRANLSLSDFTIEPYKKEDSVIFSY